MNSNIDFSYMLQVFPRILRAVPLTLVLATISMTFGLALGIILALIRFFKLKYLYLFSKIYVSFFRGTPLLAQLFLLYYGVPQIIPQFAKMTAYSAAIIGLSLHSSAYMAEIIRGAINSIDKGQMEASLSVGMTRMQAMRRVILPQAVRVAIPSLGNSYISLLKESSLAFTLGVAEMLAQAKMSAAASYRFFESYLATLLVFWMITLCINFLQNKLETRLNKAY